MTPAVTRGQVEHSARKQLVQTLLRTGPLTARGLAAENGFSLGFVTNHLRPLRRAGIVRAVGEDRVGDEEVTYSVRLDDQPRWVCQAVLGEFSIRVCLRVMGTLAEAGSLTLPTLTRRAELSPNDSVRYLLHLEAQGLVVFSSSMRGR